MGMYTELFVTARIKDRDNVPQILKYMLEGEGEPDFELPNHPLFQTDRWHFMLRCTSYYFTPITASALKEDPISKNWSFVSYSNFKNYDNEVELFFDWLRPYVDDEVGTLIGLHRYEEARKPTLVYL